MRSRELVTESGILIAPEEFLFIPLVVRDSDQLQPPLRKHLVSENLERYNAAFHLNMWLISLGGQSLHISFPQPRGWV